MGPAGGVESSRRGLSRFEETPLVRTAQSPEHADDDASMLSVCLWPGTDDRFLRPW